MPNQVYSVQDQGMPESPGEMMDFLHEMMGRAMHNTMDMFNRMNLQKSGMQMLTSVGYTAEVSAAFLY